MGFASYFGGIRYEHATPALLVFKVKKIRNILGKFYCNFWAQG